MNLSASDPVAARYEFRTFDQGFARVESSIRRQAGNVRYRESPEVYIMSFGNDENNTKIRDGLMDIKVLVNRDRGLEQWNPRMKGSFPLGRDVLLDEVFPAFGVKSPALRRDVYSFREFLGEIVHPHPELAAVSVFKQRWGFEIDGCIAELANVYINGALMRTACLESTNPEQVLRTRSDVHLEGYENVNYLVAIKRVIGMAPLPADVFYRAF
jgi:hypothetical protein